MRDVYNHFWIVAGDETRFWSSAAGAYVEVLPPRVFLTLADAANALEISESDAATYADIVGRVDTEDELTDMLAGYGLRGPVFRAPDRVTARQFKLQLLAAGLLDQVEAWIATQPRAVQIAFEYSGTFVRDEPMMQAGFAALGFTEQQVDDFFTAAAAL